MRSGNTGIGIGLYWRIGALVLCMVLLSPLMVLLYYFTLDSEGIWQHLYQTVLAEYIYNSLTLMGGVALGASLIGVSTAWLTSHCRFPGRSFFRWALILPLALPAYISAYVYTGLLEYSGPVQTALRTWFHWQTIHDYYFFNIRSLAGAIICFSLILYPYIFLLTRTSFDHQSANMFYCARTLGLSYRQSFFRISLSLARPAFIAGLSLVLMEVLADYGAVHYFGINTFTTGIVRTWSGLDSLTGAAQLAIILVLFIAVLFIAEHLSRRQAQYFQHRHDKPVHIQLQGIWCWLAFGYCLLILCMAFIVPVALLLYWVVMVSELPWDGAFFRLIRNSLSLAASSAILIPSLAVFISYTIRSDTSYITRIIGYTTRLGYALPGVIVALGILIILSRADDVINMGFALWNMQPVLIFSGTILALWFAYSIRFMATAIQSVETGLKRIPPAMDYASRSLGYRAWHTLYYVHLPNIRPFVLVSALLVFVEVMKELPATMILRPFNFDTLAVRTFQLATDERLADAANMALIIILVSLVPLFVINRSMVYQTENG